MHKSPWVVHESGAQDYVSAWVVHEKNFCRLGMGPPEQALVDLAWNLQGKLSQLGMEPPGQT